jgi:hypothetical protein
VLGLIIFGIGGMVNAWFVAFRTHEKIHELYGFSKIDNLNPGLLQDAILGAAAKGLVNVMYFTFGVILLLLAFVLIRT